MNAFIKRWLFTAIGVLVASQLVTGIHFTVQGLIVATLLLGILNAVVRPIMLVLSLPLVVISLGLFILVINALLLYWVGHLRDFRVDSFWDAFLGSLIISFVNMMLNWFTKSERASAQFHRSPPPPPPPPVDKGGGPIIDV